MYAPLDMPGQGTTIEAGPIYCQKRCADTPECTYFSFWHDGPHDGECHLQNSIATPIEMADVTSGPMRCQSTSTTTTVATTAAPPDVNNCWRAPSSCAPTFEYEGTVYSGCTLTGHGEQAWC